MKPTVWTTGGCASWYLDQFGHNTTLWPGQTFTFRRHLSRFDPASYDLTPLTTAPDENAAQIAEEEVSA
jgi:cyclohexanone monooxygenase